MPQHDRRDDDDHIHVRWGVVATIVTWIVAVTIAYSTLAGRNDVQDARLHNLEQQNRVVADDMREIKNDIKLLLRQRGIVAP